MIPARNKCARWEPWHQESVTQAFHVSCSMCPDFLSSKSTPCSMCPGFLSSSSRWLMPSKGTVMCPEETCPLSLSRVAARTSSTLCWWLRHSKHKTTWPYIYLWHVKLQCLVIKTCQGGFHYGWSSQHPLQSPQSAPEDIGEGSQRFGKEMGDKENNAFSSSGQGSPTSQ